MWTVWLFTNELFKYLAGTLKYKFLTIPDWLKFVKGKQYHTKNKSNTTLADHKIIEYTVFSTFIGIIKFESEYSKVNGPLNERKTKGADQPAHPCGLFSAFAICFLENIISERSASKISRY